MLNAGKLLIGFRNNNDNKTGDINESTRIPKYFGINQFHFSRILVRFEISFINLWNLDT